jgi:regulator of cell morphogenesis and NO signaling
MAIDPTTTVAEIAIANPATIRVFERHKIDFCCGGRIPLAEACAQHGVDAPSLVAELDAALAAPDGSPDWSKASLAELARHIQARYHRPLREELPRLHAMVEKVLARHGNHQPETLPQLRDTFTALEEELLDHMAKEDAVLFPAVIALEAGAPSPLQDWTWIDQPIEVMEADHAAAGAALDRLAELTNGFEAPAEACPTWRGLYHGLSELAREMHVHVHLENHLLFPRAAALARQAQA